MAMAGGRGERIQSMFSVIAPRYDLLNTLLSLGSDAGWRAEAASVALENGANSVLDVATGTGELALRLAAQDPSVRVVGVDFAAPMLDIAAAKAARRGAAVEFVQGDALSLPFAAESFDVVTIAYGLRNLSDLDTGLREMHRVLRTGGRLVVLEFPPPPRGPLAGPFRFYFRRLLPRLGGLISGHGEAYRYLHSSVVAFPEPPVLAARIQSCGFGSVRYRLQTFGVSAIHVGEKR